MVTVKTKTGRLSITEEKMIYTRSGVRGRLAEKYQNLMEKMPVIGEKYRKVDQEIDLKDIRKIETHPGIKGIIRPYFNVFYVKDGEERSRGIIFPSLLSGGRKDYETAKNALERSKIALGNASIPLPYGLILLFLLSLLIVVFDMLIFGII
ncbi:MAG: hypothetical protein MASP_00088 [Candidatus Methanolliviera sp. GoM_asphalt]|nr:MAG: hypothetical protein MASP_00088 [Candidatus Methanolliviera sp. GoM_asphalt]